MKENSQFINHESQSTQLTLGQRLIEIGEKKTKILNLSPEYMANLNDLCDFIDGSGYSPIETSIFLKDIVQEIHRLIIKNPELNK